MKTIRNYGALAIIVSIVTSLILSCSASENINNRFADIILTDITSTAAEVNILDGATLTVTELNYNDGTTLGTTVASKTLGIGTNRETDYVSATDTLDTQGVIALRPAITSGYEDSSLVFKLGSFGGPVIDFFGSDDDEIRLSINTSDQLQVSDAAGGLSFRMSYLSDLADSAIVIGVPAGIPTITTFATDDDTGTITANTSDQLVFTGYSGGIDFAVTPLVGATRDVEIIDAANILTAAEAGLLSVYFPLSAKRTATLPQPAAGIPFSFVVADGDSLLITVDADTDSIYDIDGTAYATMTCDFGSMTVVAKDAAIWMVTEQTGTWTSYVQAP